MNLIEPNVDNQKLKTLGLGMDCEKKNEKKTEKKNDKLLFQQCKNNPTHL